VNGAVVVVGGGLAGITAALACADAGREVTLLEARPWLGGLTSSFRRGDLTIDNGQHVFLRCCTAYRALLDRLGVADRVFLQPRLDIPVLSTRDGRAARLRRVDAPAPLHLAPALLRYRPLHIGQRVKAARAALALRGVDRATTDQSTFGAWLRDHGQDERTVAALWDLVGTATLNARAEQVSLALAAMVFQVGLLGAPDAADVGWSAVPLGQLHGAAARAALDAAGARVVTGTKVTELSSWGGRWRVVAGTVAHRADQVILATPPTTTEALLPAGALNHAPGWSQRLGTSPIVNVHVVLDGPVLDEPFLALLDSPLQWVFDRTGPAGLSRGQYLAASISAADDYIDVPVGALRDLLLPEFMRALPRMREVEVLDFFVTRERAATFRPAPGTAVLRPPASTAAPGLYLAGAWTATGWPATMEGAVRSGASAGAAALAEISRETSREEATR
jgi:squalene-associated FAD-dependent desaturase